MVDEFGMGAFSMVVVENMDMKDVAALKAQFEDIDHVEDVLWYDSVADLSFPVDMLPSKIKDVFFKGNATMMIALFDNTTSSDAAMEAVTEMRKIASKECYISGSSCGSTFFLCSLSFHGFTGSSDPVPLKCRSGGSL